MFLPMVIPSLYVIKSDDMKEVYRDFLNKNHFKVKYSHAQIYTSTNNLQIESTSVIFVCKINIISNP